ncbi:hypothetical protein Droror1_Dr00023180 [Drosera rotundifolia]
MSIPSSSSSSRKELVDDLWSQFIAEDAHQNPRNHPKKPQITVTYQRRRPEIDHLGKNNVVGGGSSQGMNNGGCVGSVANSLRTSWNRSLSTRGRVSVAAPVFLDYLPQKKPPRREPKPPIPKGKKHLPTPSFEKERAYFKELDEFELQEESPSPKKSAWISGNPIDAVAIPSLCTRLEKWLRAKKRNHMPSSSLSLILRTPANHMEPIPYEVESVIKSTPSELRLKSLSDVKRTKDVESGSQGTNELARMDEKEFEDVMSELRKLSLAPPSPMLGVDDKDPFSRLLQECGQSSPCTLLDVFSSFCDPDQIVKLGEGTYGEAFTAGGCACKIVPIDGDLRVNGEIQKRSYELLEEVILSRTLNHLRSEEGQAENATMTFIETRDLRVCQGPYDRTLIRAWEEWDAENGSENDHPQQFPEDQCYVVFVLEHGGVNLESFVLSDFGEARSLLVQVTTGLAIAEAAYEFEHRDLHWGNILLSRKDIPTVTLTLDGKSMVVNTNGLVVSIIDFTLSRIKAGDKILYLDLSLDPLLFEGEKGDKQADTYRKMREVTDDQWEGSFPRTNVLWLQYLVDMLLIKKSYKRSGKDDRDLRSLKKRMNGYNSAREAVSDPFFSDLILSCPV